MADAQTSSPEPESLRLELQEAITTFRHQWSQLMQSLGIIITAYFALLSYGFARKLAVVLLVASLMPLAALSSYIQTMTSLVPICYVAIELEKKLSLHDVPFIGTWVKRRGDLPAAIDKFAEAKAQNSAFNVPASYFLKNLMSLRILAFSAVEIGLTIIIIFVYNFRFL
jgi:hypothetical protein